MMKLHKAAGFYLLAMIVFLSGCLQQGNQQGTGLPQLPECGNGQIEFGEECETGTACPAEKICTAQCKCENFFPPTFPE